MRCEKKEMQETQKEGRNTCGVCFSTSRFSPKGFSGQLKNYNEFDRMKMKKAEQGKVGSVSNSRLRGVMGSRKAEALTGSAGEQLLMARDASKRAANYAGDSTMSGEYARFEDAQKVEGTPDGLGGDGMGQGAKDSGFGTGKPEDISNWGGNTDTKDPCKTTTGPDIGAPAGPPSKECCKEKPETQGCGDIGTNFCQEHPGDPTCQKKDEKKDPDWIKDSKDGIKEMEGAMGLMAIAAGVQFLAIAALGSIIGAPLFWAIWAASVVILIMAMVKLVKAIIAATQVIRQGQTLLGTLMLTTATLLLVTAVMLCFPGISWAAIGIMAGISVVFWAGMRASANQQWKAHGQTSEGKDASAAAFFDF